MQLHEHTAQEAGSVANPGLALGCFGPLPHPRHDPVSCGAPAARPQALRFSSAEGRSGPQRRAGLRPRLRWGSFGGTKRVAEGALAQVAGLAAHPQCMQIPPGGGHRVEGQSPPVRQWPLGPRDEGKEPWQRTRVAPRPEGYMRRKVPPTPPIWDLTSDEWADAQVGVTPMEEEEGVYSVN